MRMPHIHTLGLVHNFVLEKILGLPLIEKFRVIHIYKADWNIISKYFTAYKVSSIASKENTLMYEQSGGRPRVKSH
jgi:hypothetical protein